MDHGAISAGCVTYQSAVESGAGDLPGRDDHRDAQLLGEGADLAFDGGVDGTIHAPRMTPGGPSEEGPAGRTDPADRRSSRRSGPLSCGPAS